MIKNPELNWIQRFDQMIQDDTERCSKRALFWKEEVWSPLTIILEIGLF
jgi:hypothetical protein